MADDLINMAVDYLQRGRKKPDTQAVVAALLTAEKRCKKEKRRYRYEDLIGRWRLGFVSGTQTVRSGPKARPTKKPGKGRFIPGFIKVEIAYKKNAPASAQSDNSTDVRPNVRLNNVSNQVTLGPLQLSLFGPTLYKAASNILAFDFTKIAVSLGAWTPYKSSIRSGNKGQDSFAEQSLKDQAFFTFFIVEADYIAARGKGGGLALWTRSYD